MFKLLIVHILACSLLFTTNCMALDGTPELPGPLSKNHAEIEAECQLCHSFTTETSQRPLCLACHTTIFRDLSRRLGFHGKNPTVETADCGECHAEHSGRDAQIIDFDTGDFDHVYADFKRYGVHQELDCENCHNTDLIKAELDDSKTVFKYRNAPSDCIGCHSDAEPHDGNFGQDCSICHYPESWNDLNFDHDLSRFPLIGYHEELDCETCHSQAPDRTRVRTCRDCHLEDDYHKQQLSLNCARCHNPNGWDRWQFNHDLQTTFPLQGAHQGLECIACHKTPVKINFNMSKACVDCHQKDENHRGEFGYICDRCHQPTAFKDIKVAD